MTSSVPTPTASPSVPVPWWREWGKPIVVVAVVSVLVGMLTLVTSLGMAAFQTLRADIRHMKTEVREEIRTSEARQREEIQKVREEVKEVREEVKASEARQREEIKASEARQRQEVQEVREEIKASEARQRQELRETKAELKADNQAVVERLDRMFERLPVPPSDQ